MHHTAHCQVLLWPQRGNIGNDQGRLSVHPLTPVAAAMERGIWQCRAGYQRIMNVNMLGKKLPTPISSSMKSAYSLIPIFSRTERI